MGGRGVSVQQEAPRTTSHERGSQRGGSYNGPVVQQLGATMRRGAGSRAGLRDATAQRKRTLFPADVDELSDDGVGHRPAVQRRAANHDDNTEPSFATLPVARPRGAERRGPRAARRAPYSFCSYHFA